MKKFWENVVFVFLVAAVVVGGFYAMKQISAKTDIAVLNAQATLTALKQSVAQQPVAPAQPAAPAQPVALAQPVAPAQPAAPAQPVALAQPVAPAAYWTNGQKSRTFTHHTNPKTGYWEYWMSPYSHEEAGELTLDISQCTEVSFNSISDGDDYRREILNEKGGIIQEFEAENYISNDDWTKVLEDMKTLHLKWSDPNNKSNGALIICKPRP